MLILRLDSSMVHPDTVRHFFTERERNKNCEAVWISKLGKGWKLHHASVSELGIAHAASEPS